MIITIIAIALAVIGVVLFIIGIHNTWDAEITGPICGFLLVPLVFCLFCICDTQIGRDIEYEKKLAEREMLVYRLEQAEEDNNVVEYAELYSSILYYNNSIRKTKKWGNNPWTSWFFNPLIANLDYIDVTDTEYSK